MSEAELDKAPEMLVETVERLAKLARIRIPDGRKEALAGEFEQMLAYIAQLNELTLSSEMGEGMPAIPRLHNVFREDANPNETGMYTETLVAAFPAKSGSALSVKKIITLE